MNNKNVSKILDLYLIMMAFIIPLYMKDFYSGLGEAKFSAFRLISMVTLILLIIFWKGKVCLNPDIVDISMMILAAQQTISFAFSINRGVSFWGLDGWRNGFFTIILVIFFLLIFRHHYQVHSYSYLIFVWGSLIPIGLAVMKCFGFNSFHGSDTYLSTIGNNNWYSGYLCVYPALACGLLFDKKFQKRRIFLYMYYCLVLMSSITQGSDSIFLSWFAIWLVLMLCGIADQTKAKTAALLFALAGVVMEMVNLLRLSAVISISADTFAIWLMTHHAGIFLMVIAAILCFHPTDHILIRKMIAGILPMAAVMTCIVFLTLQLQGVFPDFFGTNRGFLWRLGSTIFSQMSIPRKLIGNGQDTMHEYRLLHAEISAMISQYYGNFRVTNAHSWMLTALLDTGILGYISVLFAAYCVLKSFADQLFTENMGSSMIGVLAILSVMADLSVSFSQTMVTPYVFMIAGIALSDLKTRETSQIEKAQGM